jgi:hypothetical protein
MILKRTIATVLVWLPLAAFAAEPAVDAAESKPPATQPADAQPAVDTSAAKTTQRPATQAPAKSDRLDLDTTVVTGNRELPKVLYIVPWKKADLGELPAQPFNTLLDEVLTPVDRDVFRREVTYYGAVNSAAAQAAPAASAPSGGTEK